MKVLIVGAGFGGLALAACLEQDGHTVTLIERQKDQQRQGFVLGLWPNGLHVLESIGLAEQVRELSIPVTKEVLRDNTGAVLTIIEYQPLLERYGGVLMLLHRDLHTILRARIGTLPIRFQTTIRTLEERRQSVSVTFSDGTEEAFDLVVGADGLHSHVRTALFGTHGVTPSGFRLWCTLIPRSQGAPEEPNDLFGEGEYVGVFPSPGEQLGVLFLASRATESPDRLEERIPTLLERFHDFGWLVPELLQSLRNPAQVFVDDIEQVHLETWYRGRIVLLGDAAHAVSPTAALGGAMALEDAHVLAEELRQADAIRVEEALERYVQRRKPRVDSVRHTANFLLWFASLEQPAMTHLRDVILHLVPSSMLLEGMEAIVKEQA